MVFIVNLRELEGCGDGGLVRNAVEDAEGERGVAEDLSTEIIGISIDRLATSGRFMVTKNSRTTWGMAGRRVTHVDANAGRHDCRCRRRDGWECSEVADAMNAMASNDHPRISPASGRRRGGGHVTP